MAIQIPERIGFVTESRSLSQADLEQIVKDALQPQVSNDFRQAWEHHDVPLQVYPSRAAVPVGVWPVIVQDTLDDPNAAGYHTNDQTGEPESFVEMSSEVALTLSHETLEMIGDPTGMRLYYAPSPNPNDNGEIVRILLEVGDPCEDAQFAYEIAGIRVSDFISHDYGNGPAEGGHYDFAGHLTAPRQVATNGYISYVKADGNVWQLTNFEGEGAQVANLGTWDKRSGMSLREWVDRQTAHKARRFFTGDPVK